MVTRTISRATRRTEEQRRYDAIVQLEGAITSCLNEIPRQTLGTLGAGSPATHRLALHALGAAEEHLADAVRLLEIVRDAEAPTDERSPMGGGS